MPTYTWPGLGRHPSGTIDRLTGAQVTISEEHWLTHKGLTFAMSHRFAAVANAASVNLLLKNPAGNYPHLHKIDVIVEDGDVDMFGFEGVVVSADGTPLVAGNTNRASSNTPTLEIFHTPTITDDGTQIWQDWAPPTAAGAGGGGGGGGAGARHEGIIYSPVGDEWILAPDTNYVLRHTNNSGGAIDILVRIMFYELPASL